MRLPQQVEHLAVLDRDGAARAAVPDQVAVEEVGVVPMPFRIYGVVGNRINYVVVGDDGQVWMRGALTKNIRSERLNIEVGIDGRVVQVNCG